MLSLLERRLIGRDKSEPSLFRSLFKLNVLTLPWQFTLDPVPDGSGELVYAFLSLVHGGCLPDKISSSTRIHFSQVALRIGASGSSQKGIAADSVDYHSI